MSISIDEYNTMNKEIDIYMNHQQYIITKYANYNITQLLYKTNCNSYNGKLVGHNSYHDINKVHKQWILMNFFIFFSIIFLLFFSLFNRRFIPFRI